MYVEEAILLLLLLTHSSPRSVPCYEYLPFEYLTYFLTNIDKAESMPRRTPAHIPAMPCPSLTSSIRSWAVLASLSCIRWRAPGCPACLKLGKAHALSCQDASHSHLMRWHGLNDNHSHTMVRVSHWFIWLLHCITRRTAVMLNDVRVE